MSFTSGATSYYNISAATWTPFGPGLFGAWDSSSGSAFTMYTNPVIAVPTGYVSGTPLSSTATKNSTTFAALGFVPGQYVTTLTNGNVSDTVTINIGVPSVSLRIGKVVDRIEAVAGDPQPLVYTVTVTNDGPFEALNVKVEDTLPTGVSGALTSGSCTELSPAVPTCSLGAIAIGASKSYTVSVGVDAATLGDIVNTAVVSSDTPNTNEDDDAAVTTNVVASADLQISKVADLEPAIAGEPTPLEKRCELSYDQPALGKRRRNRVTRRTPQPPCSSPPDRAVRPRATRHCE